MTITDELRVIVEAQVEKAVRDMGRWETSMEGSQKKLEDLQKSVDKAANRLMLFSGGVAALGVAGLKLAADIEASQGEFEVMLGSAEKAKVLFRDLQQLSAKTPLAMEDVSKGAVNLLNFNFAQDKVIKTLQMLGDAARGQADKLNTVVNAYGRVHLKGKASMEELNMLTEAGVPILAALSKNLNVSTDALFKMASGGQISFKDMEAAFASLTGEGGRFHDMMEKASVLAKGKLSTAIDAVKTSLANLSSVLLPTVKDILDKVTEWAEKFNNLDEGTKKLILTLAGIAVAIGPISKVVSAAISLFLNLQKLGPLMSTLGIVLSSPWAPIAAAVGVATIAVIRYISKQREAIREYNQSFFSDAKNRFGQMAADWQQTLAKYFSSDLDLDTASIDSYLSKFNDSLKKLGVQATASRQDVVQAIHDISSPADFQSLISVLKITDEELVGLQHPYEQLASSIEAAKKRISQGDAQPDSKKAWQDWFEEITNVAKKSFQQINDDKSITYLGAKAAENYLSSLSTGLEAAKEIGRLLGEDINPLPYLKDQQASIQKTLSSMFSIDKKNIDQPFTGNDVAVQKLIAQYKELIPRIKAAEEAQKKVNDRLADMEKAKGYIESLKTPYEQYLDIYKEIQRLQLQGSLTTQQAIALNAKAWDEYNAKIEKAENSTQSFSEYVTNKVGKALMDAELFTKSAAKAFADLAGKLADLSINATVDAFKQLGAAFKSGAASASEWMDILGSFFQTLLDQLPLLFVQAGLMAITQGNLAIGLGLIAAGLSSAFIGGFVGGNKEDTSSTNTTNNALGNAYRNGTIAAFANGAAFLNSIVSSPTLFAMANGGLGLMGEKGPEAVVPLARTSSGRLGIETTGSGSSASVSVVVNNYSSEKATVTETTDEDGGRKIEVMIGEVVDKNIASGRHDRALRGSFGLARKGVRA